MLVLLIIFMVAAPMMTQGLAREPAAGATGDADHRGSRSTSPFRRAFARITSCRSATTKSVVEILQERMKQAMLERDDKSVFVRSDAAVTMQDFMTVTDKLKEGGVEKVALHGARSSVSPEPSMDAVTQILIDRPREVDKISRMVWLSLAAHTVLIAAVAFMPADWGSSVKDDRRRRW